MSSLRLYAVVLRMSALRPGAVSANHGDQARAALFNLIRQGDFPLAQKLHDENAHKPYTISLLSGGKRTAERAHHFGEGDTADWRFTLMGEATFEALLRKYLISRTMPHVRIGAVDFGVSDAFVSGASHPDSGHIGIAELTERWNVSPDTLKRRITLDFRSPTAFSFGQDKETGEYRFRSQPDARTVFSVLRNRWKHLGGVEPGVAFDEWVGSCVETEPLRIKSQRMHVERRFVPCFTGTVRYTVHGKDISWLPLLHLLGQLTFWTGAGYQVTRGMGQVRLLSDE